ncbi:MAG TPA: DNA-3-methyladenine glycosylase [Pirellulales bacterium]|nr:DNA-3-methyladenine glycosylase [Pirellulales bacterium]
MVVSKQGSGRPDRRGTKGGRTRPRAILGVDFFARDTLAVAQELIGTTMIVGDCRCRIVETEAYTTDAASHSVTRRHKATIMRETFAHIYVYKIYGVHYCLNFTTERDGVGAVLIRAAEPLAGIDQMARRRGTSDLKRLLNGPGRLCQALAIDSTWTGRALGRELKLLPATHVPSIVAGPRIGISRATELEWRFFERGSRFVSRGTGKQVSAPSKMK